MLGNQRGRGPQVKVRVLLRPTVRGRAREGSPWGSVLGLRHTHDVSEPRALIYKQGSFQNLPSDIS